MSKQLHDECVTISGLSLVEAGALLNKLREMGYVYCRREPLAAPTAAAMSDKLREALIDVLEHAYHRDDCGRQNYDAPCICGLHEARERAKDALAAPSVEGERREPLRTCPDCGIVFEHKGGCMYLHRSTQTSTATSSLSARVAKLEVALSNLLTHAPADCGDDACDCLHYKTALSNARNLLESAIGTPSKERE